MEKISSPNAQLSIEGKTKVYLIIIYSIFVIFYLILLPIIIVTLLSLGEEKKIKFQVSSFSLEQRISFSLVTKYLNILSMDNSLALFVGF
jgi:ABC-type spermidine/putrescine transport system permease subunit II